MQYVLPHFCHTHKAFNDVVCSTVAHIPKTIYVCYGTKKKEKKNLKNSYEKKIALSTKLNEFCYQFYILHSCNTQSDAKRRKLNVMLFFYCLKRFPQVFASIYMMMESNKKKKTVRANCNTSKMANICPFSELLE